MIQTYNPCEQNDPRFQDVRDKHLGVDIMFVSGISGWSWSAKLPNGDQLSDDCFLSPEGAMDNCILVLSNDPQWRPDPFASKPVTSRTDLDDYLKRWTEEHG